MTPRVHLDAASEPIVASKVAWAKWSSRGPSLSMATPADRRGEFCFVNNVWAAKNKKTFQLKSDLLLYK